MILVPKTKAKPQQVYEKNLLFDTFATGQKYPKTRPQAPGGWSRIILLDCRDHADLHVGVAVNELGCLRATLAEPAEAMIFLKATLAACAELFEVSLSK